MQLKRMMKRQIVTISHLAAILTGQSSIEVPIGASITIPTDAYVCSGTITVNGTVTYTGSSLCVVPNAHLIASIVETSVVVLTPEASSIYWSIFSESIPIIAL